MDKQVNFYVELDDDVNPKIVKKEIEKYLKSIDLITESDVYQTSPRMTGVEIVAAIGVAIMVGKSVTEAIDTTSDILQSIGRLFKEIKGLRSIIVETPEGAKRIEDLVEKSILEG